MQIIYRSDLDIDLTPEQVDNNFRQIQISDFISSIQNPDLRDFQPNFVFGSTVYDSGNRTLHFPGICNHGYGFYLVDATFAFKNVDNLQFGSQNMKFFVRFDSSSCQVLDYESDLLYPYPFGDDDPEFIEDDLIFTFGSEFSPSLDGSILRYHVVATKVDDLLIEG